MAQLYGACACERNQYTVIIPSTATSLAHVFFDNSTANRRTQATPVTAWLRVPLDWYHSTTYAIFPDETHNSIRRTFNTPLDHPALPPTRRQFCGYCGTHLTAWNEAEAQAGDTLDVTLGSLLNDSLLKLEALNIVPDTEDEDNGLVKGGWIDDEDHIPMNEGDGSGLVKGGWIDDEDHIAVNQGDGSGLVKGGWIDDEDHIPVNEGDDSGLVKGGWIDDEDHIPLNQGDGSGLVKGGWVDDEDHIPVHQEAMGAVEGPGAKSQPSNSLAVHRMQNRGIPYFEEMVENSRLGRIKRQKGGHQSQDGRITVQWEVVEMDNSEPSPMETAVESGGDARAKRQKINP